MICHIDINFSSSKDLIFILTLQMNYIRTNFHSLKVIPKPFLQRVNASCLQVLSRRSEQEESESLFAFFPKYRLTQSTEISWGFLFGSFGMAEIDHHSLVEIRDNKSSVGDRRPRARQGAESLRICPEASTSFSVA